MLHEGSVSQSRSSQPAAAFVNMSDPAGAAPKRPTPPPLTLEEKLWFDRRKSELQQYAGMGGGLGAAVCTAISCTHGSRSSSLVSTH